jgi:hypothetical protein
MTKTEENNLLSFQKVQAAQQLARGMSVTKAAETVGITRQTLSEWKNHDSEFQAEVKKQREKLWRENLSRVRSLTARAIDVLSEGLESEDFKIRLTSARAILSVSGLGEAMKEDNKPKFEQREFWRDATPQERAQHEIFMRSQGMEAGDTSTLKVKVY